MTQFNWPTHTVIGNSSVLLTLFLTLLLHPVQCLSSTLVGPYSGQVSDSMTGEPIAGASVLITWEKFSPIYSSYATVGAVVVFTDGKGKYELSPQMLPIIPPEHLYYTRLVIYQPGYQLFKIGRCHKRPGGWDFLEKEKNFKKRNYRVRLDRVPPVFNHRAHFQTIAEVVHVLDKKYQPSVSRLLKRRAEWELSVGNQ